jgi:hypothetical protein
MAIVSGRAAVIHPPEAGYRAAHRSLLRRARLATARQKAAYDAAQHIPIKKVERRRSILRRLIWCNILSAMSATEVIEQFKALPANERAQVAKFVVENEDSWIPESFKQGMADAESGRFVDLDTALNEPYPGDK